MVCCSLNEWWVPSIGPSKHFTEYTRCTGARRRRSNFTNVFWGSKNFPHDRKNTHAKCGVQKNVWINWKRYGRRVSKKKLVQFCGTTSDTTSTDNDWAQTEKEPLKPGLSLQPPEVSDVGGWVLLALPFRLGRPFLKFSFPFRNKTPPPQARAFYLFEWMKKNELKPN